MNKATYVHYAPGVRVEQRDNSEAPRQITGRAIVFGTPTLRYKDDHVEIYETISPEAVTEEILAASDIRMTMFHDPKLLLARSCRGDGTLSYNRRDAGVD